MLNQPTKTAPEVNKKSSESSKKFLARKAELEAALPKSVKVLGVEIPVNIVKLSGLQGDYDTDKKQIRIHYNLSIESAKSTIFHEALHAALDISGHNQMLDDKQEEALIRLLEQAFFPICDIYKLK